jgi:hypothetical protein
MRITIDVELKDFAVPNFVIPVGKTGKKEDGPDFTDGIPLRDLEANVLSQLCDNFRAEVFRKAERQDPRLK